MQSLSLSLSHTHTHTHTHTTAHTHTHCTQVNKYGSINFPRMDDLGLEYSVFYVVRMTGGRMGRVIDGKTNNW